MINIFKKIFYIIILNMCGKKIQLNSFHAIHIATTSYLSVIRKHLEYCASIFYSHVYSCEHIHAHLYLYIQCQCDVKGNRKRKRMRKVFTYCFGQIYFHSDVSVCESTRISHTSELVVRWLSRLNHQYIQRERERLETKRDQVESYRIEIGPPMSVLSCWTRAHRFKSISQSINNTYYVIFSLFLSIYFSTLCIIILRLRYLKIAGGEKNEF